MDKPDVLVKDKKDVPVIAGPAELLTKTGYSKTLDTGKFTEFILDAEGKKRAAVDWDSASQEDALAITREPATIVWIAYDPDDADPADLFLTVETRYVPEKHIQIGRDPDGNVMLALWVDTIEYARERGYRGLEWNGQPFYLK